MASNAQLIAVETCIQAHAPVFLWGPPGTGKTATLEAIADVLDEPLWTVILSIREPSDQGGLPIITPQGVRMHPPLWAAQLAEKGHGIVFMDEFNTAPPTTQSSALRVVHGGWAGDQKLPEMTSFVAAGNPPKHSSGGYDLTSAIANRWVHFDWEIDPASWSEGMVAGWPPIPIARVGAHWRTLIASKRGLVATFMRRQPGELFQLPKTAAEQGQAWPSPRCYDDQTEVLTRRGFVAWSEVRDDDEFATIAPNGEMAYGRAVEVVRQPYRGPMVRIQAQHIDLLVTPNHQLLVAKAWRGGQKTAAGRTGNDFVLMDTRSVLDDLSAHSTYRMRMRSDATWNPATTGSVKKLGSRQIDYEVWAEFVGWYLTDGYLRRSEKGDVIALAVTQVNEARRLRIASLAQCIGARVSVYSDRVVIHDTDALNELRTTGMKHHGDRFVPRDILEQGAPVLGALLRGVCGGDGWVTKGTQYVCVGYCQQLADDIQEACVKLGVTAHVRQWKGSWIISVMTTRYARPMVDRTCFSEEEYDGVVYCAGIPPNHTLLVRRNGHIVWSGNTWDRAATLLAAASSMGYQEKSEVTRLLVKGCVGEAAAQKFVNWVVNLDLRDPEEYLAKPLETPLPQRADQIMATLDSVAAAALDRNYKQKERIGRYYAAWKVMGRILKKQGDIGIPAARTLATNMPAEVDRKLPPEVEDILPMLERANIDFSAQP